ncbi:MAG TPA: DUF2255 family protein [Candidatus Limnocylindria bacterium]
MTDQLPGDVLGVLRETREIDIETRAAPDVPPHRTTIWVVVDDEGRAFIRTYRGPGSRWYREATAAPTVGLLVDGQRIEVALEAADDPERVDACSQALRAKYAGAGGLRGMLAAENLPTTLELRPVPEPTAEEVARYTPSG